MARVAIAIVALALVWRAITVNALLYGDDGRPRPVDASGDVQGGEAGAQPLQAMLRENPANAAAYLALGQEYASHGDDKRASGAFAAAHTVAPVDRDVLMATASSLLHAGRVGEAIAVLATAVADYGDTRHDAFPVMVRSLASGHESAEWDSIVASDPAWLGDFVVQSCAGGTDPAVLVPLFLKRVAHGTASERETDCLVEGLRRAGRWPEAYQVWLDTLSRARLADVGYVFNGDFEFPASGVGFDWRPDTRPERDSGHTVEFSRAQGVSGARALRIAFNGKRQSGVPIMQYLALPPGRYEFSGRARPDGVRAGHGLQWTVRCVASGDTPGDPIAASGRFVGSSDWEPFSFPVVVPPDCAGQLVQLEAPAFEGVPGPVFLAGALWFDNIVLRQYH